MTYFKKITQKDSRTLFTSTILDSDPDIIEALALIGCYRCLTFSLVNLSSLWEHRANLVRIIRLVTVLYINSFFIGSTNHRSLYIGLKHKMDAASGKSCVNDNFIIFPIFSGYTWIYLKSVVYLTSYRIPIWGPSNP